MFGFLLCLIYKSTTTFKLKKAEGFPAMNTELIKVLIVDDNIQIQKHFQTILQKDLQISVEGIASNGYEAALLTALIKPDIILINIHLENKSAACKVSKEILKHFPDTRIILLFAEKEDKTLFADFQTIVTDCIHKNASQNEVIASIKDAFNNNSSPNPFEESKLRKNFQNAKTEEDSLLFNIYNASQLTSIELDVLDLLVQGKSQKEICDIIQVEVSALKTLIISILKKFDKEEPSEVIEMAQGLNLLEIIKPSRIRPAS
jgi:DNA-binding NarL/FixJ family response regulator